MDGAAVGGGGGLQSRAGFCFPATVGSFVDSVVNSRAHSGSI